MNRFIKKTFFILPVLILFSCENFFWPVKDSDSDSSVKTVSTANRTIRIPGDDRDADFVMIDVNIEGGIDEIILGEDLIEVPYRTTVSSFSLARYETSYNTWYEVLQWANSHDYTIVKTGREGEYGAVGSQTAMNTGKPKFVEMPVCGITWRDAMVWCNALSEMCGLSPVYCTDPEFKTPLRDSTGTSFSDLNNYAIEPGQVDNPYVNKSADGFRLPYVEEWEYAARKKTDGGFISGRNVSGDETGSAIATTPTEKMNGLDFPISTRQNEYCWQRGNSASNGPKSTATGKDDTNETLSTLTRKTISGKRMHLSGGKLPNHLGFYDMSGNVPEWCFDYDLPYGSSYKFSTARMLRGGDHLNEIVGSRCSGNKGGSLVGLAFGFRIAQNIPASTDSDDSGLWPNH